jgi:ADP-ribose pyrophosphatase YjhB (NUDIX family)
MSWWKRGLERTLRPLIHVWARTSRGATLGVRGLVLDNQGRVLLVEHSYVPGWHLPGGGVDPDELPEHAVARELEEEAGVRATSRPRLLSVHDNRRNFRGDHVLMYRVDAWTPGVATSRGEIIAADFFAMDALPPETTRSTRRRLAEALEGVEIDPYW